jgi:hypothetical protein
MAISAMSQGHGRNPAYSPGERGQEVDVVQEERGREGDAQARNATRGDWITMRDWRQRSARLVTPTRGAER